MASAETKQLADEITARNAKRNVTERKSAIGYKDPQPQKPLDYFGCLDSLLIDSHLCHPTLTDAADRHNSSIGVLRSRAAECYADPDFDVMTSKWDEVQTLAHKKRESMLCLWRDTAVAAEIGRDIHLDGVVLFEKDLAAAESELAKVKKMAEDGLKRAGFSRERGRGMSPNPHLPAKVASRQIDHVLRTSPHVREADTKVKEAGHMLRSAQSEADKLEALRKQLLDEINRTLRAALV